MRKPTSTNSGTPAGLQSDTIETIWGNWPADIGTQLKTVSGYVRLKTSRKSNWVTDPASETTKQPKIQNAVRPLRPSKSLRVNTEELALACLNGDEEALAIVDSYRFRTSRATRLAILPADDPAFSRVFMLSGAGGTYASQRKAVFRPVRKTRAEIAAQVDKAFSEVQEDDPTTVEALWVAVHLSARHHAQAYKQASLREAERGDDLVNDLTAHTMAAVLAGKFTGNQPLSHWLAVVFRNLTATALNDLTWERNTHSGLLKGESEDNKDLDEIGYVSEDQLPREHEGSDALRAQYVELGLSRLSNKAYRMYADLLMNGLSQKQAAASLQKSVVTCRKWEHEIGEALQAVGFAPEAVQA